MTTDSQGNEEQAGQFVLSAHDMGMLYLFRWAACEAISELMTREVRLPENLHQERERIRAARKSIDKFLSALDEVPSVVEGFIIEWSIQHELVNSHISKKNIAGFRYTGDCISFWEGGSVNINSVGNDTFTTFSYELEVGNLSFWNDENFHPTDAQARIQRLLSLGADIEVHEETVGEEEQESHVSENIGTSALQANTALVRPEGLTARILGAATRLARNVIPNKEGAMGLTREKIIGAGVGLFVLMGLFPPWKEVVHFRDMESQRPAGYNFILKALVREESSGFNPKGVEVDVLRLLVQWATVAGATFGLLEIMKKPRPE